MPVVKVLGMRKARIQRKGETTTAFVTRMKSPKYHRSSKAKSSYMKRLIKSVVSGQEETKYLAENISAAPILVGPTQTTPLSFGRMLPLQAQGVADNQRIGDSIAPVSARTFWTFYLNRAVPDLFDVTLNLVVVHVKGATTDVSVAAIQPGQFLKVGDGTNTDIAGAPIDILTKIQHYPVNTDQFTLKKWYRKRICKGANDINGPVGAATNNSPPTAGAHPCLTLQYKWKPPKLKYNDAAQTLPRNHYPVYLVWATCNDGAVLPNLLSFNIRSELHYKDA